VLDQKGSVGKVDHPLHTSASRTCQVPHTTYRYTRTTIADAMDGLHCAMERRSNERWMARTQKLSPKKTFFHLCFIFFVTIFEERPVRTDKRDLFVQTTRKRKTDSIRFDHIEVCTNVSTRQTFRTKVSGISRDQTAADSGIK
jgi:hypothetical protein